jgi:hypothetical protein
VSDDWKVGDLALCVDARMAEAALVQGCVYRVAATGPSPCSCHAGRQQLWLEGVIPSSCGSGRNPNRFRKIRPDEHEACEEEFKILLNLSQKRVSA